MDVSRGDEGAAAKSCVDSSGEQSGSECEEQEEQDELDDTMDPLIATVDLQLGDDLQLSDAARADVYAALNDVDDETLLQSFLEELEELEVNRTRP